MNLQSPAFTSGGNIPTKYSCQGQNVSPPLDWNNVPSGTHSLALIVDDPDAPHASMDHPFTHWLIYNLPPDVHGIPEGYLSGAIPNTGVAQGRDSIGEDRYDGPCPPAGPAHHYYFRLYALDDRLDIGQSATRDQLIDKMHGHILEETELVALYART